MSGIDVYDEDGDLIVVRDMITYQEALDSSMVESAQIEGRLIEDTTVFMSRSHTTIVDPIELLGITGTIS
jgi:hypothetical protein